MQWRTMSEQSPINITTTLEILADMIRNKTDDLNCTLDTPKVIGDLEAIIRVYRMLS